MCKFRPRVPFPQGAEQRMRPVTLTERLTKPFHRMGEDNDNHFAATAPRNLRPRSSPRSIIERRPTSFMYSTSRLPGAGHVPSAIRGDRGTEMRPLSSASTNLVRTGHRSLAPSHLSSEIRLRNRTGAYDGLRHSPSRPVRLANRCYSAGLLLRGLEKNREADADDPEDHRCQRQELGHEQENQRYVYALRKQSRQSIGER